MNLNRLAALLFLLPALATVSGADTPGEHPAYIHALQDLRAARGFLEHLSPDGRVDAREQRAIDEIDAAIGEIKHASIDDGKNLEDHPPVDAHLKRTDRFHNALACLDKAHHDIAKEEDDPYTRGLQHRALHHIDDAHHNVKIAMGMAFNE